MAGFEVSINGWIWVSTEDTYDAFGQMTASGATATGTLSTRAARTMEPASITIVRGTMLPQRGRFISEDPLEFGASDGNLYGTP